MFTEEMLKKFFIKNGGEGDQDNTEDNNEDNNNNDDNDSGNQNQNNDDSEDQLDVESLPDSAQKLIKKLRGENAKRRTDYNNMSTKMEKWENGLKSMFGNEEDEDSMPPERQLEVMSGQYESAVTENAILKLALENGISGSENYEYFEFQMSKTLNSLGEGEEMTEETFEDILSKCSVGGARANTSTNDSGKGGKGPDRNNGQITQEEFNAMGTIQQSVLYNKDPELYKQLMAKKPMR